MALGAAAKSRFRSKESVFADNTFRSLVFACALALLAVVGLIVFELITQSHLSMKTFGFKFLHRSIWDPVAEDFGALPFIYGTLVSSFIALILAVPLSVGTALFLTELCPDKIRGILSLLVELLAAIPSVIYGLWGIFVLAPFLRAHVEPFLGKYFGWTGLFTGSQVWHRHAGCRNHSRHHDPADHRFHYSRGRYRGSPPAKGSSSRSGRNQMGNVEHGRLTKCPPWRIRRHHSWSGTRARRNHGCHDGDW